jgi:predicted RNase H-like HicB family nuclease
VSPFESGRALFPERSRQFEHYESCWRQKSTCLFHACHRLVASRGNTRPASPLLNLWQRDGELTCTIELEREEDGRWIAEVPALPGVLCYGHDRDEAVAGVQALALGVIAERLEDREAPTEFINVTFQAA